MGELIKIQMKKNKIGAYALAEKLKLTPVAVYGWLKNETQPNIKHLKQLAKVLNCSALDLLGDE